MMFTSEARRRAGRRAALDVELGHAPQPLVDVVQQAFAEARHLGIGDVAVGRPLHDHRDQPQDQPRLGQVRVEHLHQPRAGVLRHGHGVLEGQAGGATIRSSFIRASQSGRRSSATRATGARSRQAAKASTPLGWERFQHVRGDGVVGVGAGPEAGGGSQAQGVESRLGEVADVDIGHDPGRRLHGGGRLLPQRAPEVGRNGGAERTCRPRPRAGRCRAASAARRPRRAFAGSGPRR